MDKIQYLKRFQVKPFKSSAQEGFFRRKALAEEISKWSGGKLSIPLLLKWEKEKGEKFVRKIWEESKSSDARDQLKLMKWKYGQVKIIN